MIYDMIMYALFLCTIDVLSNTNLVNFESHNISDESHPKIVDVFLIKIERIALCLHMGVLYTYVNTPVFVPVVVT